MLSEYPYMGAVQYPYMGVHRYPCMGVPNGLSCLLIISIVYYILSVFIGMRLGVLHAVHRDSTTNADTACHIANDTISVRAFLL